MAVIPDYVITGAYGHARRIPREVFASYPETLVAWAIDADRMLTPVQQFVVTGGKPSGYRRYGLVINAVEPRRNRGLYELAEFAEAAKLEPSLLAYTFTGEQARILDGDETRLAALVRRVTRDLVTANVRVDMSEVAWQVYLNALVKALP